MHKIFGKKESATYLGRRGAYIIPIKGEEVGVVETQKVFSCWVVGLTAVKQRSNVLFGNVLRKWVIKLK